jgi:rhodanese-related sulfurtransferase
MKTINSKQKTPWILIAVGILAVIVIAVLVLSQGQSNALPANISVQAAADRFGQGTYLLDVREPSEWNEAHIDGAVLIPLGELSARMDELPVDEDILIICRSGNRSGQARDLLRAAGFSQTTSITGGINGWISAGLPVVSGP